MHASHGTLGLVAVEADVVDKVLAVQMDPALRIDAVAVEVRTRPLEMASIADSLVELDAQVLRNERSLGVGIFLVGQSLQRRVERDARHGIAEVGFRPDREKPDVHSVLVVHRKSAVVHVNVGALAEPHAKTVEVVRKALLLPLVERDLPIHQLVGRTVDEEVPLDVKHAPERDLELRERDKSMARNRQANHK